MHVSKMAVRMCGFPKRVSLDDALRTIFSHLKPLGKESIPFSRALGRVLAEDVVSKVDIPPFDRSAVDGYAVKAADTFGATSTTPKKLRVVGTGKPGSKSELRIRKGEAVRLMTGSPMPRGADAVLMAEYAKPVKNHILALTSLTPGKNISAKGEDVRAGETVLRRGRRLRPEDIGMLASISRLKVRVFRRPNVAIISTGSELKPPGTRLNTAQIMDINSYSLAAKVTSCGGTAERLGIVPDEPETLRQTLQRAMKHDVIIISGGSSVGEHDLAPEVVAEVGDLMFHGVAMRPGGPSAFGVVNGRPVFCLAGFPVASLVAFDMLVRPALWVMQHLPPDWSSLRVKVKLVRKIPSSLGRVDVVRVRIWGDSGKLLAEPIRVTGSSILSSMTLADGFVIVPGDVEGFDAGTTVEAQLYS